MYKYAVVDDIGQCYGVYMTTNRMCDQHHVPIEDNKINYLSKYYYPIPQYICGELDFDGDWYIDVEHTIREEAVINA